MYIQIYMHTYMYIYINMYIRIHVCICIYMYIYIYVGANGEECDIHDDECQDRIQNDGMIYAVFINIYEYMIFSYTCLHIHMFIHVVLA
jgi:accessory gene regulator protein AgrB